MRRIAVGLLLGLGFGIASAPAMGQITIGGPATASTIQQYYSAPGYYGTTYGTASYGLRQTYTTFSSPYGAGYSYGYAPPTLLPGRYGVGLWAPATVPQPYVWRSPYYGTYAIPSAPVALLPPIGVYAPAFGPGLPPRVFWR